MTHIMVGYRKVLDKRGEEIMTYSNSTMMALKELGYGVTPLGEGHQFESFDQVPKSILSHHELFIDLDCGRNAEGKFNFSCQEERAPIPSAVRWVDSHGHPSYHKRASVNYDHVFFAVWAKRDLFIKHPSAHWCPNASDARYFSIDAAIHANKEAEITTCHKTFDVGFFGSKGGLSRTKALKEIAERHTWKVDIREIGRHNRSRWPATAQAMDACKVMFNCGQKHDGPNQRVIESMLMNIPLVTDRDKRDGMSKLFDEGEHFLGYTSDPELADNIEWCLREPSLAHSMALRAYKLAWDKHQVKHRVAQILEVCGV